MNRIMTGKKRRAWVVFMVFLWPLYAYSLSQEKGWRGEKSVFCLTVPKSGTHLLKKILLMVMNENEMTFTNVGQAPFKQTLIPYEPYFFFNHVFPAFADFRSADPDEFTKVILIRDPRDAIVSFMHMLRNRWPWAPQEFLRDFSCLSEAQQLSQAILMPDAYLGLHLFFQEAIEWMRDPSVLVVRFEDLVGPEGGGTRYRQKKALKALFKHLGFNLTREEIDFIAYHAYGPAGMPAKAFRNGQIGTWPQYFTEYHKELFKFVMGDVLIQLGYEKDNNW